MRKIAALLATVAALVVPVLSPALAPAQEAMEKKSYNYSAWTPGIFS